MWIAKESRMKSDEVCDRKALWKSQNIAIMEMWNAKG